MAPCGHCAVYQCVNILALSVEHIIHHIARFGKREGNGYGRVERIVIVLLQTEPRRKVVGTLLRTGGCTLEKPALCGGIGFQKTQEKLRHLCPCGIGRMGPIGFSKIGDLPFQAAITDI